MCNQWIYMLGSKPCHDRTKLDTAYQALLLAGERGWPPQPAVVS
jgi:hypothetical protein